MVRSIGHVRLAFASATILLAACSSPAVSSFGGSDKSNSDGTTPAGTFDTGSGDDAATATPTSVAQTPPCDAAVAQNGGAEDFAKAIGVCTTTATDGYGLTSATFTHGYNIDTAPKADQHGVLAKFGSVVKPREGSKLGVLSTGFAQEFDGSNGRAFDEGGSMMAGGAAPPGFPKAANGCQQSKQVNDVINLRLKLKAPEAATGFSFDFNFHSSEWPNYICSEFNDGFVAFLTSKKGAQNISFDKNNNPVSMNNGFFDRCTAGVTLGCSADFGSSSGTSTCPGGPGELAGTGFGLIGKTDCGGSSNKSATRGGATGWLSSTSPVESGEEFTLELMIWDAGDSALDSSVLIDNFKWVGGVVATGTTRPPS